MRRSSLAALLKNWSLCVVVDTVCLTTEEEGADSRFRTSWIQSMTWSQLTEERTTPLTCLRWPIHSLMKLKETSKAKQLELMRHHEKLHGDDWGVGLDEGGWKSVGFSYHASIHTPHQMMKSCSLYPQIQKKRAKNRHWFSGCLRSSNIHREVRCEVIISKIVTL